MNLSTIIEKKKDEFAFFLDGMGFSNEDIEVILPQAEKAIRESVEEALRVVRPNEEYEKSGYFDSTMEWESENYGYNEAMNILYTKVKEFMK